LLLKNKKGRKVRPGGTCQHPYEIKSQFFSLCANTSTNYVPILLRTRFQLITNSMKNQQ